MHPDLKKERDDGDRQFTMAICYLLTVVAPPCAGLAYDKGNIPLFIGIAVSGIVSAAVGLIAHLQGPAK